MSLPRPLSGQPVEWQQWSQVILVGHRRQLGQHIPEVAEGVAASPPDVLDHGKEDRAALAGIGSPDKEPVLGAELGRPDGVLGEVVVDGDLAVLE